MELGPITLDQSPLCTQIRVQNGGARMALLVRIGLPRFLKPRSAHQPHFHELCQDHVAEQREEKDWPI
jgi:hypothetical protein